MDSFEKRTRPKSTQDLGVVLGGRVPMTKTHGFGTFAAIGSLTATIALLTGLPAVSADELADLRANQELLQRRIEQIAQGAVPRGGGVPGAYGTEAVPGVAMSGGS